MAAAVRLSQLDQELLRTARRAVLATIAGDGRAALVPVCFCVAPDAAADGEVVIYSPLDAKPKRGADPLRLARVRNLLARPAVTLLVDRWDEDWTRLAWLRLEGAARILPPPEPAGETPPGDERAIAIAGLRARYPQYRTQALESHPLVRIAVSRVVGWSAA